MKELVSSSSCCCCFGFDSSIVLCLSKRLQILKKDIPFGNELIDECGKKLPNYQIHVNVTDVHQIQIRVTQTNLRYEYKRHRSDGLILLVGDSFNQLIFYDDM